MAQKKMPTPDVALKNYFKDNRVFADVFNTYMFGREILHASDLHPVDTEYSDALKIAAGTEKLSKYRDLIRKTALGAEFIILGIENQNKIHYAMPLRVMLYDVLGYSAECKALGTTQNSKDWTLDEFLSKVSKDTKLTPIFTIVFYTGETKWDGPCSLYDMLNIGNDLKEFVPNYPIHVIDIGHEDYDFHTESLRELSHVLQAIYAKTLPTDNAEVSNSTLNLAGILSGSQKLYSYGKGGKTIMCKALQEMIDEGVAAGIAARLDTELAARLDTELANAKLAQLIELVQEGLLSVTDAARKAKLSEEAFKLAMNK